MPGCSGRSISKACRALCCLNSSLPVPQVPGQAGPLALICKFLAPPTPLLGSSAIGPHSFQVFLSALLVRWGWEPQQLWLYLRFPCLGGKRGVAPGNFQFSKQALSLEEARPGTPFILCYELIPLLGVAQKPSRPVTRFSLEGISSACLSACLPACLLAQVLLGYTASMCSASTSGQMCLGDTFNSGQTSDSAFCMGVGKPGRRAGKTPFFEDPN